MDRMPRLSARYDQLCDGAVLSIVDNIFSNNNLEYSAVCHALSLEYDLVECCGLSRYTLFLHHSSCY